MSYTRTAQHPLEGITPPRSQDGEHQDGRKYRYGRHREEDAVGHGGPLYIPRTRRPSGVDLPERVEGAFRELRLYRVLGISLIKYQR